MNLSQFEDAIDRYGADINQWPVLRDDALRLIETSAEARAALAAMTEVEIVLRSVSQQAASGIDTIAARAVRHRQITPVRRATRRAAWAAAAATALLLGLFVGNVLPEHYGTPDNLMSAAFDSMEFADVD